MASLVYSLSSTDSVLTGAGKCLADHFKSFSLGMFTSSRREIVFALVIVISEINSDCSHDSRT